MHTDPRFERARQARDPRFDGRFFVAVRTTGIYCRPVCPAVTARRENVRIFLSAAAAGEAGYRPCLRCRPECAPGSPAWLGTSTTVRRGLRLIAEGALDADSVDALAERLGVTARHLRRLFAHHVGASPQAVAHTQRLHFAKSLIDQTTMPMADIAVASGFGSTRRFNDAIRRAWQRTPTQLRRLERPGSFGDGLVLRLPYYEPYDWQAVLDFFETRAIPCIEQVEVDTYRRVVRGPDGPALVTVRDAGGALQAGVAGVAACNLHAFVTRLKDAFDTDAPIADISAVLSKDALLAKLLGEHPGIRVPGSFDRFESIVRAILGQQVSVRAATTLATRVAERYGEPVSADLAGEGGPTRLFPPPARLAGARLEALGITSGRAATIRRVATEIIERRLPIGPAADSDEFEKAFTAVKGIGPWTARYTLLRAMKDPDAFPATDLGLVKALGAGDISARSRIEQRATAWRPWRAYAAMLLWKHAAAGG